MRKNVLVIVVEDIVKRIRRLFDSEYDIKLMRKRGAIIGSNCSFGTSYIDPGFLHLISIGDNVTLANATILAHDASTKRQLGKSRVGKVKIGDNVFVGWQALILPNVTIGNNVIVGAHTLVCRDIPSNSVVVGNPGKVIGKYTDYIAKHKEYMKTHPVFDTYHAYKSKEQMLEMQEKLEETWGYDE